MVIFITSLKYWTLSKVQLTRLVEKKKKVFNIQLDEHMLVSDSTTQMMEFNDLYKTAQEAIEQLPEKRRIIFQMSREQQMTHEEIANSLGISKKTVENQIGEALKFLKTKIKPHHNAIFLFFMQYFIQ